MASRNLWRQQTPGSEGWAHSPQPQSPDKYFMVSADNHAQEPNDLWTRVSAQYRDRTPRIEVREDGSQWLLSEGGRPSRVRPGSDLDFLQEQEKFENFDVMQPYTKRMEEEDIERASSGLGPQERSIDMKRDGVDAEMIYPQKGMFAFATPDPLFANDMCRTWNRWALETFGEHFGKHNPGALVTAGDLEGAIAEVTWAAKNGFRALTFGCKPIYGPDSADELQFNDPMFEPLWALVAETGLPINFHVSTGKDPRSVGGRGGAIINYVLNGMTTTLPPLVTMIASGVFERHPTLKVCSIEAGIGMLPWFIEAMDHSYRAHHMWVRPVIPELPSYYFKRNCFASFQMDEAGLRKIEEFGLVDNVLWANDYPHHEGSWPHSAASIERQMGHLSDGARAKILGLNAARVYGLTLPEGYAEQFA